MGAFKRRLTARHDPSDPATLGDLARDGLQVFCWCHRCGHNAELDTAADRAPWPDVSGPRTWRAYALHLLRCARCRHQAVMAAPWRRPDCALWLTPFGKPDA